VGGAGAEYADAMAGLQSHLLPAALWVCVSMFCLFFLFTGSVVLPLKALVLNVLSLSATLGVLTWVFIGGQTWLVGPFVVAGSVDASIIVLTVVVVFALSMDYEVFILLRIKEESLTAATRPAVAEGLRQSAFIITVAAGLLALVFVGFVFSGVTTIKVLGAGVTIALMLDATLVRVLLMPATMILAGR
jgi:RND superfamily putative drug exporter